MLFDYGMKMAMIFASCLVAACIGPRPIEYSGDVRVVSAELVPVNPDIKTVADSDQPMFYARDSSAEPGAFWLFHDGGWYRATSIHGPWVRIARPPVPVLQIDQPYAYTHWRVDHPDQTASTLPASAAPEPPRTRAERQRSLLMFPQ
jgi:hypothetical protein